MISRKAATFHRNGLYLSELFLINTQHRRKTACCLCCAQLKNAQMSLLLCFDSRKGLWSILTILLPIAAFQDVNKINKLNCQRF